MKELILTRADLTSDKKDIPIEDIKYTDFRVVFHLLVTADKVIFKDNGKEKVLKNRRAV